MSNGITAPLSVVTRQIQVIFGGGTTPTTQADDRDIEYWLTPTEIADAASGAGPTIDLTAKINNALGFLYRKYVVDGNVLPSVIIASMACEVRFHKSYLVQYIDGWPGMTLQGDSSVDTRLVQHPSAARDFLTVYARNGSAANQYARSLVVRDMSLQGNATSYGPDPITGLPTVPLKGVYAETKKNDPAGWQQKSYNSIVAENVRVLNFTGDALDIDDTRPRTKLRYCFFSNCGVALINGVPAGNGINIGAGADLEITGCGSGSHGGSSVAINGSDTPQIRGGDYWASKNAALGYHAIDIVDSQHFIVDGPDVNGVCQYTGPVISGHTINAKGRWTNINFRFRESSFGDGGGDGTGITTPAPQPAYLITKNAHGIVSDNNTFEPSLDSTPAVDARPSYIYQILGDASMYVNDTLPALTDPLWPAGANLAVAPTYATICNDFTKLGGSWTIETGSPGVVQKLFSQIAFLPGMGPVGAIDGSEVGAGYWGEIKRSIIDPTTPLALTLNQPTNLLTLPHGAGDFDVVGTAQFLGHAAVGNGLRLALSAVATGTLAQMLPDDPTGSDGFGQQFANINGPIVRLRCSKRVNSSSSGSTTSLNAYAGGEGISVFGSLTATRRAH